MDWTVPDVPQMVAFRKEVQAWLEANIPAKMKPPIDARDFTEEQYWFWRGINKQLGAKGWLFPTMPKEYGGGGLTPDHESVLAEELDRARWPGALGAVGLLAASLLVWATEEQKQKFLVPILKGEKMAWQKLTEPQSGADLANYQSTAVRDGDDWVITGNNVFISGSGPVNAPDYLYGPVRTDPNAPRHRNLGYFIIPVPSPGLDIREMDLVLGHNQHFIFLDRVRVPAGNVIGGDHQGWQVLQTHLEQEHGGRGQAVAIDTQVDNAVRYMQAEREKGKDDIPRELATVDSVIGGRVVGLRNLRNYWKYQSRQEMSWEGALSLVEQRIHRLDHTRRARDIMGMYAMLGTKEPRAVFGGVPEVDQRGTFVNGFGAGGITITKVIIARRIGISRTQERAAPTPATATRQGS